MNQLNFLFRLVRRLTCLLVAGHAAFAQGPGPSLPPGRIVGRVQNAATGQYLNNARVSIQGTDLSAFTDQTGTYRLANVPGGQVVLDVFHTGLDAQQRTLSVAPGQTPLS